MYLIYRDILCTVFEKVYVRSVNFYNFQNLMTKVLSELDLLADSFGHVFIFHKSISFIIIVDLRTL